MLWNCLNGEADGKVKGAVITQPKAKDKIPSSTSGMFLMSGKQGREVFPTSPTYSSLCLLGEMEGAIGAAVSQWP